MNSNMQQQKGVVLIVSLIMLLIITLVGVSSMQSSTMQERMAANSKHKFTSQLAAEAALKAAEQYLATESLNNEELLANVFYPVAGHYTLARVNAVLNPKSLLFDVDNPAQWDADNSIEVTGVTSVARMPRYVIEYVGMDITGQNNDAQDINNEFPEPLPHYFRVTAIGWSQDENIYTVLESSYMSTP